MEIPKPTEADKDFFRSVLPDDPAVEIKPMFGNLGAFVHGNMFAGLFGPAVGVRLDDAGRAELEPARGLAGDPRGRGGMGGAGAHPCRHAAGDAGHVCRSLLACGRSPMSARCRRRSRSPRHPVSNSGQRRPGQATPAPM